jgi:hypothetical protein
MAARRAYCSVASSRSCSVNEAISGGIVQSAVGQGDEVAEMPEHTIFVLAVPQLGIERGAEYLGRRG